MARPTLTSELLVRKACPAITSDHVGTNPIIILERPNTYIWSTHDWRKASTSLFDQHMIKDRYCTYIWSTHDQRKAQHLYLINTWSKKGSTLISDQHMIKERLCTYIHPGWNTSYHNDEMALHLHPPKWEHILLTMMEGLALISDHEETHGNNHIRMPPSPPRLSYLVTDLVPPFS